MTTSFGTSGYFHIDHGARASLELFDGPNGQELYRQPIGNEVSLVEYTQADSIQAIAAQFNFAPLSGTVGLDERQIPFRTEKIIGRGTTVRKIVKSCGPLNPLLASHYFWRVLKCVEKLEEVGAVHRDLGYQNLLLDLEGEVFVGDWDEARYNTYSGEKGSCTPVFKSPEEIFDEGNTKYVDLHTAIVSGFKIITGEYPFLSTGIKNPLVLQVVIAKAYSKGKVLGLNEVLKKDLSNSCDGGHLASLVEFFDEFRDLDRFKRLPTARSVLERYETFVMEPHVFPYENMLRSRKKELASLYYLPGKDTESSVKPVK